jgi:hypothetical protein
MSYCDYAKGHPISAVEGGMCSVISVISVLSVVKAFHHRGHRDHRDIAAAYNPWKW